eukprot:COSAG02_NODE_39951_length_411_cov_0.461538_1_plen_54_part_10
MQLLATAGSASDHRRDVVFDQVLACEVASVSVKAAEGAKADQGYAADGDGPGAV